MGSVLPIIFSRVLHLFLPSIFISFLFLHFFKWLSVLEDY
ncbi:putative membrane chloride channel (bestrophin family) [Spirochaeta isovalerica]|uniref:Putative membrane chloride channel (Bestrophin family) n=1 Tax=Spirochaeta isovalerica TaxID=150 RepID=A0A841R733_9SPIO|nr:putative membrane chloride channel (bestrophin family) [Spirochaeta isovalerica]